jgi:hypothetical protein
MLAIRPLLFLKQIYLFASSGRVLGIGECFEYLEVLLEALEVLELLEADC